jgi:hypothetical protein
MVEKTVLDCYICRNQWIVTTPGTEIELRQLVKDANKCKKCGGDIILQLCHINYSNKPKLHLIRSTYDR